jgi:hypothetical protein
MDLFYFINCTSPSAVLLEDETYNKIIRDRNEFIDCLSEDEDKYYYKSQVNATQTIKNLYASRGYQILNYLMDLISIIID